MSLPFDESARQSLLPRFRQCPPEEFAALLLRHAPRTPDEALVFEKYLGWAHYDSGENVAAREHLLRALRLSAAWSEDRALLRGLLSELYVRRGSLQRAERVATRAMAEIPAGASADYLRAGHLNSIARVLRRLGQVEHAISTYQKAERLLSPASALWNPVRSNLVVALTHARAFDEAEAILAEEFAHEAERAESSQRWSMFHAAGHLALAQGEGERAARIHREAWARFAALGGERVRAILLDLRAAIERQHGEWRAAEATAGELLAHCRLDQRLGDMVAATSRGLAESLAAQGRHAEACGAARRGVACGSVEDRAEHVASLRWLGTSLAAMGNTDEAKRAFAEAMALHERCEFHLERARLERAIAASGLEALVPSAAEPQAMRERARLEDHVLRLSDGLVFRTRNRTLAEGIRAAGASRLPVLIEGETGTGKELVARYIHERCFPAGAPFVVLDARSATEVPGSEAPFAAAAGGTLFVDALAELPVPLQMRLLRVAESRAGAAPARDAVRVLAATQEPADALLSSGRLRPELFHRLNGHRIALPPLRERPADLEPIALDIVLESGLAGIERAALELLRAQRWPGNVRQLELVLRVAASRRQPGERLRASDLQLEQLTPQAPTDDLSLREAKLTSERSRLLQALRAAQGNVTHAATALGISRQALYKAIRRHGIERGAVGA